MKVNPRSEMILLGADKGKRQLLTNTICKWGFPCSSVVNNPPANAGNVGLIPRSERPPWRREWLPTPVFLPGAPWTERSLVGYSPWGHEQSS